MELRVLHYFLAVAREQSISKAAESLHLSQPTLSTQLKNMEEEDVVVEMTSSVSPCVIKGKNSNNAKYLVLPVRLVR